VWSLLCRFVDSFRNVILLFSFVDSFRNVILLFSFVERFRNVIPPRIFLSFFDILRLQLWLCIALAPHWDSLPQVLLPVVRAWG